MKNCFLGLYCLLLSFNALASVHQKKTCEMSLFPTVALSKFNILKDELDEIRYFGWDRYNYQVFFKDGRILNASGKPLHTVNVSFLNFKAIWVMDEYGNFFTTSEQLKEYVHHGSLVNGRPISAAGEWVVRNGLLKKIDDFSPHYHLDRTAFRRALSELNSNLGEEAMGTVVKEYYSDPT